MTDYLAKRNEKHEPKPYRVTLTREFTMVVIATSRADAEEVAEECVDEAVSDSCEDAAWTRHAVPMVSAEEFAGTGYIPYGLPNSSPDRDKTLDDWLKK